MHDGARDVPVLPYAVPGFDVCISDMKPLSSPPPGWATKAEPSGVGPLSSAPPPSLSGCDAGRGRARRPKQTSRKGFTSEPGERSCPGAILNVLEEMSDWLHRPLDRVHPVVFVDAIVVKVARYS